VIVHVDLLLAEEVVDLVAGGLVGDRAEEDFVG
jgi:hypothetical protein